MPVDYSQLNHFVPPMVDGLSDAWRRVLSRLGDYTSIIVRSMNLRPTAVTLHTQTSEQLLVRISTPGSHLILRVAPEDDLAAYVYFTRTLAGQGLPATQIIQRDLSRRLVPFAFTLENYVPGVNAAAIADDPLLRGAGRQAGRVLRKMHRVVPPAMGRPTATGRWPSQGWRVVLRQIARQRAAPPIDALVFGEPERTAISALLDSNRLDCIQPNLMHGNFGPQMVRCTVGAHIHLEAIVDAGRYVSGDGLYDLACGLSAAYPEAWRSGLLEGYQAAGPLSEQEQERLQLLCMLTSYWAACQHYIYAEPHEADRNEALRLMQELKLIPQSLIQPIPEPSTVLG